MFGVPMQNRTKKLLWLATALIAGGVIAWALLGGKSTGKAEIYKAELRAKGEKLTFAELGFPKPPEDGAGLSRLTNAVNRLTRQSFQPGRFVDYSSPEPGRVMVVWRGEAFLMSFPSNQFAWTAYHSLVEQATNELAEIRAAAESPVL